MKGNNSDFIKELYEKYHYNVLKTVKLNCFSSAVQDYEDIVQEVFLSALKKSHELRTHENVGGWLVQTAVYHTYDFNRKLLRNLNRHDKISIPQPVDEEALNRMEAESMDESAASEEILNQINAEESKLYTLRYQHQLSYREIAKVLDVSENYVGVKISRLNFKLKTLIKNLFEDNCNI